MRKRRHSQEAHESSTGIDLAPMLDFVINLLIFFIITAVFIKESGLTVNRPTSFEQESKEDSKSIQIQILDNGEIWVDNRVDFSQNKNLIVAAITTHPPRFPSDHPLAGWKTARLVAPSTVRWSQARVK